MNVCLSLVRPAAELLQHEGLTACSYTIFKALQSNSKSPSLSVHVISLSSPTNFCISSRHLYTDRGLMSSWYTFSVLFYIRFIIGWFHHNYINIIELQMPLPQKMPFCLRLPVLHLATSFQKRSHRYLHTCSRIQVYITYAYLVNYVHKLWTLN